MKTNGLLSKMDIGLGLVCVFMIFCLLTIFTNTDLGSYDLWLHLKTGEVILQDGAVPHYDIYSFTRQGSKWVDHGWLFQVAAYSFYNKWQVPGLFLMKTAVASLTFLILILVAYRRRDYLIYVVPLLLCLLIYQTRFHLRPGMLSALFFSFYILIIGRYLNSKWYPFVLIPIQIIWVNMHGFFFLGPLLVALLIITDFVKAKLKLPWGWSNVNRLSSSSRKKLCVVFLFLIFVNLINPYFLEGALYPARILFSLSSGKSDLFFKYITELKPPITNLNIFTMPFSARLTCYLALIAMSLISFGLNFKKIDIFHVIIWAFFFAMASVSARNVGYFCFVAYFIFLSNISGLFLKSEKVQLFLTTRVKYILKWIVVALILFSITEIIAQVSSRGYYLFDQNKMKAAFYGISKVRYPEKGVDFLLENKIQGNIYNEFNSGAYLIGRCYPQLKVFIDGRTELYGENFFKMFIDITHGDTSLFDQQVKKYDISVAFLNSVSYQIPEVLLRHLYKDPHWKLVYFDEFSVIFLKDIKENRSIIKKFEIDLRKWQVARADLREVSSRNVMPYGNINRAYTLYDLGFVKQAIAEAREAIRVRPNCTDAYKLLSSIYYEKKLYSKAFDGFRIAGIFSPGNPKIKISLAMTLRELGDLKNAKKEIQEAIRMAPKYAGGYYFLATLFEETGNDKKAIESLKKAIKLKPSNTKYLVELGELYFKNKNFKSAHKIYSRALELDSDSCKIHNNLGLTLFEMGLFKEAEKEFKKALELDSSFAPVYNNLGVLYAKQNQFIEAKKYWRKGLKLDRKNSEIKDNLKKLRKIKRKKK